MYRQAIAIAATSTLAYMHRSNHKENVKETLMP